LTTLGSTKFKLKDWKCYLKKLQCKGLSASRLVVTKADAAYFKKVSGTRLIKGRSRTLWVVPLPLRAAWRPDFGEKMQPLKFGSVQRSQPNPINNPCLSTVANTDRQPLRWFLDDGTCVCDRIVNSTRTFSFVWFILSSGGTKINNNTLIFSKHFFFTIIKSDTFTFS